MLRALFQLVVIAGGVALGMSKLDSSAMKRIEDSMIEFAGAVGWREATTPHPEAQTVQPGGPVIEGGSHVRQAATPPQIPQKAFYSAPLENCYWEKVIDPSNGHVECSVSDRRSQARISRNQPDRRTSE